mgnify:CR=1 FL=1
MNLMSNAVKYTPDGGNVTLTIKEKPNGFSELGCYEFSIEDNGIGMTPEFQKIMFEPFSRADDHRTTKVQGTGLGMAITRNIVNLMNGDIQVEKRSQQGNEDHGHGLSEASGEREGTGKRIARSAGTGRGRRQDLLRKHRCNPQEIGIAGEWS